MSKNLDKIKRSFLSNLPFKVAAVLIAFLLWFVVLNATDPIVNDDIRVTLDVRNVNSLTSEPIHRHLVNYEALRNTQITITVRGTQREIDAIRQNLTAYIDLSAAEVVSAAQTSTQFSTRVHVYGVSGNVLLQTHSPGNVTLQLDSIVTRYINVEFEPIGEIDAGYIAVWEEAVIEPNVLRVTGPSSSVDSIYKFLVEVNQEGLTESWRRTGFEPLAVTATGGHVATAHVQFGSVNANVPVYRRGNVQIVAPVFEGTLAAGFGIAGITADPPSIAVAGTNEAIANLEPIVLPPITALQMENASANFAINYNINDFLPQGVFVANSGQQTVAVNVSIEPIIQRTFNVNASNINISGAAYFEILTPQVSFIVSGMEGIVANISNIAVSANLSGLEDGEHTVMLTLSLPNGVQLTHAPPSITVVIGNDTNGNYEDEPSDGEPSYDENEEQSGGAE